jgi:hypothetical protein
VHAPLGSSVHLHQLNRRCLTLLIRQGRHGLPRIVVGGSWGIIVGVPVGGGLRVPDFMQVEAGGLQGLLAAQLEGAQRICHD